MATRMAPQPGRLKPVTSISRVSHLSRPSRSAFSTALKPWDRTRQPSRPSISTTTRTPRSTLHTTPTTTSLNRRHASSAPATAPQTPPSEVLTWDRFFNLRRKRRYLNLGSSVVTASTAIGIFGPVIASQDIDGWAANVMGLDPILVLGATTFAVATMGWLCGPSFGTAMFRIWAGRRGWNGAIAEKEKSFFARIKRYRADPSSSSLSNPIPDYYGEKIASVRDYRRWLKDQRAFNLKKNKNMI